MTKRPRITKATGRSVAEWIGRTPDSRPPDHVVLRIFERYGGRCHITGLKIQIGDEWDVEHIKRLEDAGENRESNMAPALKKQHLVKTAEENKRGKKADRTKMRHIGITKPKVSIPGRGFPQIAKSKDRDRPSKTCNGIKPLQRMAMENEQ